MDRRRAGDRHGRNSPESATLFAIIALTGLAMGFRNATIAMMKVADLTTTVLTLTLTGLAADSTAAGGGKPELDPPDRGGGTRSLSGRAWRGAAVACRACRAARAGRALVLGGTLACIAHPAANGVVKAEGGVLGRQRRAMRRSGSATRR